MTSRSLAKAGFFGLFLLIFSAAQAQQPSKRAATDFGRLEYESKCALCHGPTGKGDGPMASFITRKVPDLSTLSKNNKGVLPVSVIVDIIAGEKELPAHGSRDMPIWGSIFRAEAYQADRYPDVLFDSDAYVRARILMLVDYLNRLQVK
jgi:mono/diheme cytochrome c family protein